MLEARAQSDATIQLTLFTSNVDSMLMFYELLGFIVVEDHEYKFGRYLVMALDNNAGAQICLAPATSDAEHQRVGKQFFRITAPKPFMEHQTLHAHGFRVSEYSDTRPTEGFAAYDTEGNEVLVVEARMPRRQKA